MSRSATFIFLLFCLLTAGCSEEQQAAPDRERAVPVRVVAVKAVTLRETVEGIGTLTALQTVEIRPEVSGFVREIGFTGSETVAEGTVLYRLNNEKLQRQLEATRAELEAAREQRELAARTVERRRELVGKQLVSEEQFDQARTELQQAEAETERLQARLELIEEQIKDTVLRAPFAGKIDDSRVDPGDLVEVGDHLTTLYLQRVLEMTFTLPERYVGRVRAGQPVEVSVTAFPDRTFEGEVVFVSPAVTEVTRDFRVKARVDNPAGALKPGSFGRTLVVLETLAERPVVPEEALVALREGYMVFVVENGVARRREVRLGLRQPGQVEIREGVAPGETVVRQGHMQLEDGDPVRVLDR